MKTRILRCLAGAYKGQLVEYSEPVAERLLAVGRAEEPGDVRDEPRAEVAILPKVSSTASVG